MVIPCTIYITSTELTKLYTELLISHKLKTIKRCTQEPKPSKNEINQIVKGSSNSIYMCVIIT